MNNPMQMLQQLKADPMRFLAQRFNLPSNLHDPQAILNHLMKTGQVSQEQINRAYQMAQRFR